MPHGDGLSHEPLAGPVEGREDAVPHAPFERRRVHVQKEDRKHIEDRAQAD